MREIYEFMKNVYYHIVGCRNDQNKSCRPWRVLQLCCWWLLHHKSFAVKNYCLKLSFLKIQNLNCSNQVTWKDGQNESCKSRWVLELCSWQLFHLRSSRQEKLWNNQNEKCRSRKVIELYSWQLFDLISSFHEKLHLNFLNLKFKFFKRPRMEKQQKQKL